MIKIAKLIVGKQTTKTYNTNKKTSNKRPEYEKSEAVISAENALNEWEKNKPGEYKSKYSDSIDQLLDDILNREDFTYNMNADPMYQRYRENYVENGKKAMMDTIGEATALTGGYLNSYAATVGNQVYDEYLNELNDIILALRDRAYEQYVDEGDKLIEDVTILRSLDGDEYERYWNSVQQYYSDGEYLIEKLVTMSDAEFEAFLADVDAWESDRAYTYQKEQDDREYNYRKEKDDRDYAFAKEKEENDKQEFQQKMDFEKSESERDQANEDRNYALAVKKAGSTSSAMSSSSSSSKSSSSTQKRVESTTKDYPRSYNEFVDRTGVGSILTENEFYSSPSVRKKHSTYQNYLKVMYQYYV